MRPASAAVRSIPCYNAPIAVGREEGNQPFGSIALALCAGDWRINVSHGTQGVETMFTVQASVLIYRHYYPVACELNVCRNLWPR